jgi:hypothetical protein
MNFYFFFFLFGIKGKRQFRVFCQPLNACPLSIVITIIIFVYVSFLNKNEIMFVQFGFCLFFGFCRWKRANGCEKNGGAEAPNQWKVKGYRGERKQQRH